MANPIGRYRPPYPTREELLGLSTRKTSDPPPAVQVNPVPKPAGRDLPQPQSDSPPAPPQKDDVLPLPRKDNLSPTRWNGLESSTKEPNPVGAHKDSPVVWSKPLSLVEEIRQRRSEKKLKPVGPPNLSLGEINSITTPVPGNISPKLVTDRPLPSLPVQPTLQQLPPRNANLPGRQVKPLVDLPKTSQTDAMGSSKSKPVQPEISAPMPRRPLQSNTMPRAIQTDSEETRPMAATSGRENLLPRVEGNTMLAAELSQKRLDFPKPRAPPLSAGDVTTKALPEPNIAATETRAASSFRTQRPQPTEPKFLSSPMPPPGPAESYSTAISDLGSFAGRLSQDPPHEDTSLPGAKDPEEYENDKIITLPSPSNYTDNSASVSPVKDSNDSITPPSSYPDEDDRPLTPLNAPPTGKSIIWNLNTVQYRCYVEHRNMKLSKNERHPMPWNLVDMLAKEGKTGAEVKGKMEEAPGVI
ncbi:hypothetical protein FGG08_003048 [Glutinoglossum americanum]|uniref:Uncharacterized protein n=1 Tax=Glutinoglossum americanum TaxID=1670608 RepID=A0A9P8I546_9PEZI|nr:hypothetical protein FGG08_003048 [Glutinoglossum americanum]